MKRLRAAGTVTLIDPSGSVNVLSQITDLLTGIQSDVSQIVIEYNKEVFPTLGTLPQGKQDPRWNLRTDDINPRINNLDGANIFVDTNASEIMNGGRFWYSSATTHRPKTIKEALIDIYNTIAQLLDSIQTQLAAESASTPVSIYNTSHTAGNLVEDDVRSIVLDGTTISAASTGDGIVTVTAPGSGGGSSATGSPAPKIVVGNSLAGDTADDCDYLDDGNGANLEAAILAAGALSPDADVWIRPGVYDYSQSGGPSSGIIIPASVKVRGAGASSVSVYGNSGGNANVFTLSESSELEDVSVFVPYPTDIMTGDGAIEINGLFAECRRVVVDFLGTYQGLGIANMGLSAAYYVHGDIGIFELDNCFAGKDTALPAFDNITGMKSLSGFEVAVAVMQGTTFGHITNCKVIGSDIGFHILSRTKLDHCFVLFADIFGCYFNGAAATESSITHSEIMLVPPEEQRAFQSSCIESVLALRLNISSNKLYGYYGIYCWDTVNSMIHNNQSESPITPGIILEEDCEENIVLGNIVSTDFMGIGVEDLGVFNDVAHNIGRAAGGGGQNPPQ